MASAELYDDAFIAMNITLAMATAAVYVEHETLWDHPPHSTALRRVRAETVETQRHIF